MTCSHVCDVKKIMNVYYNSDFVSLFVNLLNTPARMTSNNFLFLLHPAYLQMEFHFSSVSVLHFVAQKIYISKGCSCLISNKSSTVLIYNFHDNIICNDSSYKVIIICLIST